MDEVIRGARLATARDVTSGELIRKSLVPWGEYYSLPPIMHSGWVLRRTGLLPMMVKAIESDDPISSLLGLCDAEIPDELVATDPEATGSIVIARRRRSRPAAGLQRLPAWSGAAWTWIVRSRGLIAPRMERREARR